MKKIILILMVLINLSVVDAQTFDKFTVDIELEPNGLARETISLDFIAPDDLNFLTYSLLNEPKDISVYDKNPLSFDVTQNENYDITVSKQMTNGNRYNIFFEFTTEDLVEQLQQRQIFSFLFIPNGEINDFTLNLKLPQGFLLSDINTATSPEPNEIQTDGRAIVLTWNYQDVNDELPILVVYERGFQEEKDYTFYWLIPLILLILFAVIISLKREKKRFVLSTLSHDERSIVGIIIKNKEITQKEVSKRLNFSKSKMAKIVRRLEEKNIIEKKPFMKTNKLKINKKLKK